MTLFAILSLIAFIGLFINSSKREGFLDRANDLVHRHERGEDISEDYDTLKKEVHNALNDEDE